MTATVTILLTALAALLGAWAGARVALERFKKERTFDVQLEWYSDVVRLLFNTARELRVVLDQQDRGEEVTADVVKTVIGAAAKMAEQADTGYLFASLAALEALQEASLALTPDKPTSQMTEDERLDVLRRIEVAYSNSARKVAAEGRHHLGLDRLQIGPLLGEGDADVGST